MRSETRQQDDQEYQQRYLIEYAKKKFGKKSLPITLREKEQHAAIKIWRCGRGMTGDCRRVRVAEQRMRHDTQKHVRVRRVRHIRKTARRERTRDEHENSQE